MKFGDGRSARKGQGQPQSRFEAIFRYAPDAIVIVNADGTIIAANDQVMALFGHSADELVGREVELLLPERYRGTHAGHREGFRAAPRIREMGAGAELFGLRADGTEFPVEISLSPLPGEEGEVMAAIRDVTDRKAVESRSQAILQFAPDATIIVDGTGQILSANRQMTALFGHSYADLLGMQVEALVPERFRQAHVTHRDSFSAAPRVREMGAGAELFGLRADGTEFPVEISLSPLPGPGSDVMATVRDVTDRRLARDALKHALEQERDAAQKLREASRIKDEFLDIVAHELRTPVTAIGGFADLLDRQWDSHDEPTRRDMVARILRNSREMSALVERLLDMSRLQAGRVDLALEEVDIAALLHAIVDGLTVLADRPVTIQVDSDPMIVSDPSALRHIVSNFLTNAAKFAPADVPIEVRARESEGGLLVEVQDYGLGIPAEDVPHLFEHFYQGDNQPKGGRGAGIGLSVARRYSDLLGGKISASSTLGEGSLFSVWLPRHSMPSDGSGAND